MCPKVCSPLLRPPASDTARARIVAGASRFLETQTPDADKWFGTNEFMYPGIAGYKALRLLMSQAPQVYDYPDASIWRKCMPAIIGYPRLGNDDDAKVHAQILKRAYCAQPDELIKWLLASVDRDNAQDSFQHFHKRLVFDWDDRLRNTLMAKAQEPNLKATVLHALLRNLMKHQAEEALNLAQSLIALPIRAHGMDPRRFEHPTSSLSASFSRAKKP